MWYLCAGGYSGGLVRGLFEKKASSGLTTEVARGVTVVLFKIEELEEQCSEINREKENNTQLKRRIEELESELREKETVSKELCAGPWVSPT